MKRFVNYYLTRHNKKVQGQLSQQGQVLRFLPKNHKDNRENTRLYWSLVSHLASKGNDEMCYNTLRQNMF